MSWNGCGLQRSHQVPEPDHPQAQLCRPVNIYENFMVFVRKKQMFTSSFAGGSNSSSLNPKKELLGLAALSFG